MDGERSDHFKIYRGDNSSKVSSNMEFVKDEEQFKRVNPANRYRESKKEVDFRKMMKRSMATSSVALSNGILRK